MHAFDVLGDPVRRRILELLAANELASGEVVDVISAEFGISQAAVSQHLKVLRESGFANVRPEGTRRVYALDTEPRLLDAQAARPSHRDRPRQEGAEVGNGAFPVLPHLPTSG